MFTLAQLISFCLSAFSLGCFFSLFLFLIIVKPWK